MNPTMPKHAANYFLVHLITWVVASSSSVAALAQLPDPGSVFRDCPDCPEMVIVPAGSFTMGSPGREDGRDEDEGPQHAVTIAHSFAVGRHEITRAQYAQFQQEVGRALAAGNCWFWSGAAEPYERDDASKDWRNPGFAQDDGHPVVCINWYDAKAFTAWLSRKTGKTYRLLTESEWEYAARARGKVSRPWGDDAKQACSAANVGDLARDRIVPRARGPASSPDEPHHTCDDGYGYTAPVGRFTPNRFGLHDMIGNVWEWTEDCRNPSYRRAPGDGGAWLAGDCARRQVRGGSWIDNPRFARSAARRWDASGNRDDSIGFRVAQTLAVGTSATPDAIEPVLLRLAPPVGRINRYRMQTQSWWPDCSTDPVYVLTDATTESIIAIEGEVRTVSTVVDSHKMDSRRRRFAFSTRCALLDTYFNRGETRVSRIDSRGRVLSTELTPSGERMAQVERVIYPGASLAHPHAGGAFTLAEAAVRPGDTWTAKERMYFGPVSGTHADMDVAYRLEAVEWIGGARMAIISMNGPVANPVRYVPDGVKSRFEPAPAGYVPPAATLNGEIRLNLDVARLVSLTMHIEYRDTGLNVLVTKIAL